MPKRSKTLTPDSGERDKNKDLLTRIRERWTIMSDADRENRQKALDDLRFLHVPGEQWDQIVRKERGNERPMYEFNKLRVTVKRVINDMRANRPAGKVRAVEDGDKDTADVYEGLIRNIWNVNDGDTVIDGAAEYQVGGGMGAWRVSVDYADNEAFDQQIKIEGFKNPFCVYADPSCQDMLKRDAADWIITEKISKDEFKSRYPKAEAVSFEAFEFDSESDTDWRDSDTVRIVEYWWKEPVTKTLLLLSTGETVNAADVNPQELAANGVQVIRQRECHSHDIMMCIAGGGDTLLEKPTKWAGRSFPFVMVYGDHVVIDGKSMWFGLTRFSKDAQRAYNYSRTNAIESVALAPQAKWWATPQQALGHTEAWAQAHKKNYPFQLYNADPQAGGPPQRMGGADVPQALIQEMMASSEDIKSTSGIFDSSLGQQSNETSGRAIVARQKQGEIATFNYMDNLSKGIRRTWEILIDLIPTIYDTQKTVRILGSDGVEDYAKINTMAVDPATGEMRALNDLGRGKYDVTVTVGPSFATQRQEAVEIYTQLAQSFPPLMQVAGDKVFKAMDVPYAEDIAERLKTLLPPAIQKMEQKGNNVSPEVAQAMAQVDQAMAQVQEQSQLVQQAAAEADQKSSAAEKALANLKVANAQFDADVEKAKAELVKREADFTLRQANAEASSGSDNMVKERESLSAELQQAVAEIQQASAKYMQDALAVIAEIQARSAPTVINQPPPRIVRIDSQRINGKLVAVPVYENQVN